MFYIALIPVFRKQRLVDLCEPEAITGQYSGLYNFLYYFLYVCTFAWTCRSEDKL